LLDSFLVRSEQRAGGTWFELSHDRLVEPVQADNLEWEQANLHPLQVQARLWEQGRRNRGLLLGAEALPEAVKWAHEHAALVTAEEREFLAESRDERAKEAATRRRLLVLAIVAVCVAIVVTVLGVYAWLARAQAEASAAIAVAAELKADVRRKEAEDATAVAEAAKEAAVAAEAKALAAEKEALIQRDAAETAKLEAVTASYAAKVAEAASKTDKTAAVVAKADAVTRRDEAVKQRDAARVATMMIGARELLVSGQTGLASLVASQVPHPEKTSGWRALANEIISSSSLPDFFTINHHDEINSVEWSPDSRHILTASGRLARIWSADGSGPPLDIGYPGGDIWTAAWSPDGDRILTASTTEPPGSGTPIGSGSPIVLTGHKKEVFSAAWSPNGKRILTASSDNTARVWNADGSGSPRIFKATRVTSCPRRGAPTASHSHRFR
jgi:hypothetical protein